MFNVSNEYKTSMKSPLRNPSHMKVSIYATSTRPSYTYNANNQSYLVANEVYIIDDIGTNIEYATLEDHYMRVDGTMRFCPKYNTNQSRAVFTSRYLVSETSFNLNLKFSEKIDLNNGFTVYFGDNYPTRFYLKFTKSDGTSFTNNVANNNDKSYYLDTNLSEITQIDINIQEMKYDNRARIKRVQLGREIVITNDDIISANYDEMISPISESLPQTDFSIKAYNINDYFDYFSDKYVVEKLRKKNNILIQFGYEINDNHLIEWINRAYLNFSDCEIDYKDKTTSINATDCIRNLDDKFITDDNYKITDNGEGKSLGNWFKYDIIKDTGLHWYFDDSLHDYTTDLPFPEDMSQREALQLIANVGDFILCANTSDYIGCVQLIKKSLTLGTQKVEDFTMENDDIMSSIKMSHNDQVKAIVKYYKVKTNSLLSHIYTEQDKSIVSGNSETFYFDFFVNPDNYVVQIDGKTNKCSITEKTAKYITIEYLESDEGVRLDILAIKYTITEKYESSENPSYKNIIEWDNPIIDNSVDAKNIASKILNYNDSIFYEYKTRGNPELVAGDIIRQYNPVRDIYEYVMITEQNITFNGAISANIKTISMKNEA